MMNNFRVYIKENGEYKPLKKGTSIFPLNFGQLLDERLDEAYLHIVNSDEPIYKTLTEIKIELVEEAHTENEKISKVCYYIVANDKAYEMPVGSGKYKHEIYLIERTKLLEGIYCQSLTFTNALGTNFAKLKTTVTSVEGESGYQNATGGTVSADRAFYSDAFPSINAYKLNGEPSPLTMPMPQNVTFLDFNTIGQGIAEAYKEHSKEAEGVSYYNVSGVLNTLEIKSENASVKYEQPQSSLSVNLKNPTTLIFGFRTSYTHAPLGIEITVKHGFFVTVTVSVVENQYPTKPWTVKDCIERVLDLAQPLYSKAMNKPYIDKPKYKLNAEQAKKYDKIIAPEFSMTKWNWRVK